MEISDHIIEKIANAADQVTKLANAAEQIAKKIVQEEPISPLMTLDIEVSSSEVSEAKVLGYREPQRCVTYTVASTDSRDQKHSLLKIRFLLEEDPVWRAGQRLQLNVGVME